MKKILASIMIAVSIAFILWSVLSDKGSNYSDLCITQTEYQQLMDSRTESTEQLFERILFDEYALFCDSVGNRMFYSLIESSDSAYNPYVECVSKENAQIAIVGDLFTEETITSGTEYGILVYTDEEYLYVGEFHDGGKYVIENHEHETAEGTHYALCTKYELSDLTTPIAVYTLRNNVQGICFTPEGKVVLSTSYGLTDTVYYVYSLDNATDSGKYFDGAPVYYLDNLEKEIHGPAMGEDLDYFDGKIITLTESASAKYIFGRFFGATKIVALEIE